MFALVFSSGIAVLLYVLRVFYSHTLTGGGMVWNLFLAWLPLVSALLAYNLATRRGRWTWLPVILCAAAWLLFFPNGPYMLTDIVHIRSRYNVPLWYDVLMFGAFAWNGTFVGLVSLYLMQALVRRLRGPRASWFFALGALSLSGFGVYLGRFPRYNSWDVLTSPFALLTDLWERFSNPGANLQMFAFTALFSLFLASAYLMSVAVVQFPRERYQEAQH